MSIIKDIKDNKGSIAAALAATAAASRISAQSAEIAKLRKEQEKLTREFEESREKEQRRMWLEQREQEDRERRDRDDRNTGIAIKIIKESLSVEEENVQALKNNQINKAIINYFDYVYRLDGIKRINLRIPDRYMLQYETALETVERMKAALRDIPCFQLVDKIFALSDEALELEKTITKEGEWFRYSSEKYGVFSRDEIYSMLDFMPYEAKNIPEVYLGFGFFSIVFFIGAVVGGGVMDGGFVLFVLALILAFCALLGVSSYYYSIKRENKDIEIHNKSTEKERRRVLGDINKKMVAKRDLLKPLLLKYKECREKIQNNMSGLPKEIIMGIDGLSEVIGNNPTSLDHIVSENINVTMDEFRDYLMSKWKTMPDSMYEY